MLNTLWKINKHFYSRALILASATLSSITLQPAALSQSYNPSLYYQNPDTISPGVTRQSWALTPCRDPWINIAYSWAWGARPVGSGDQGECWTGQYSGGRWSDYNQLLHSIAKYRACMQSRGLRTAAGALSDGSGTAFVIFNSSGQLVGNDSASLVAQGGGTFTISRYQLFSLPNYTSVCAN